MSKDSIRPPSIARKDAVKSPARIYCSAPRRAAVKAASLTLRPMTDHASAAAGRFSLQRWPVAMDRVATKKPRSRHRFYKPAAHRLSLAGVSRSPSEIGPRFSGVRWASGKVRRIAGMRRHRPREGLAVEAAAPLRRVMPAGSGDLYKDPRRWSEKGLTIITVILYAALLGIIVVVLTSFASFVIRRNAHAQRAAEALAAARGGIAVIEQEVRHADWVYSPTSVFGTSPGQLSLATREHLPADEKRTYVDFYVDDERLYRKREGKDPDLLMSEIMKVENLVFTRLDGTTPPAVRMELTVVPAGASTEAQAQGRVSLMSTAALRSYSE